MKSYPTINMNTSEIDVGFTLRSTYKKSSLFYELHSWQF